jgi:hypothetical protein
MGSEEAIMPETSESEQVTCRKCHITFVPSFEFDFYPDGEDPKVGLCERCMMEEAFSKNQPETHGPVAIPAGYEETVCQPGKGKLTCSFLGMTPDFECLKGTAFEPELQRRRQEGSMGAQGDNCSGPPDFKVQIQPAQTTH